MKNPEIICAIGNRLAEVRKSKGLSQQSLADEADLSKSTIQRIEKGTIVATLDTMITIANVLKVDLFELVKLTK